MGADHFGESVDGVLMLNTGYRALSLTLAGVLAVTGFAFSTVWSDIVGAREIGLAALLGFAVVWCAHETTSGVNQRRRHR
jgi:hypothetical protein